MTNVQTVKLEIQVSVVFFTPSDKHADNCIRLGELECECDGSSFATAHCATHFHLTSLHPNLRRGTYGANTWLLVGHLHMHAMRISPPQARHTHLKGQVSKHGRMDVGAS